MKTEYKPEEGKFFGPQYANEIRCGVPKKERTGKSTKDGKPIGPKGG